jgi:hypothetical protein
VSAGFDSATAPDAGMLKCGIPAPRAAMSHLDLDRLERDIGILRSAFEGAVPFPHVVVDDCLREPSYRRVLAAMPPPVTRQRSSDYIFARNKFENPQFDRADPVLAELREELTSPRFAAVLQGLCGKPVFVDPDFTGGGIHQGGEGSFLDMHADFSRHPARHGWLRELNILLYLNEPYDEAWGGHLELESLETGARARIAPVGNRLVVMLTKRHTLHGYRRIAFPEGRFRTSIASYAYTEDADYERTPIRSTAWRPERGGVKRLVARLMPGLIRIKTLVLGSSTVRRARRD